MADAAAVNAMAEAALKQFGRIDYLVNNAALRGEKPIEEMTFEEWRDVLGVDARRRVPLREGLPGHQESGAGAIVNSAA